MTPLKTEAEATQPEAVVEEARSGFRPIVLRGGSSTAGSDEVLRGRGYNPDFYEDEPMPESDGVNPLQIQQCCVVLEEAEKAGKTPITLEWFRDYALLHSYKFDWLESAEFRQRVIGKAIQAGAIRLGLVPGGNGTDPSVTTLERVEVESPKDGKRFNPVPIRGEPLSATIIRDRGER